VSRRLSPALTIFLIVASAACVPVATQGAGWTIVPSANTSATDMNRLFGVSCLTPGFCVAVGSAGSGPTQTLAETWDGNAWTITASPNLGTESYTLNAVSCVSATFCMAVGNSRRQEVIGYDASGNPVYASRNSALIERWDGTSWQLVPNIPLTASADNNELYGVSCVSPTFCAAVGFVTPTGSAATLVLHFDGTAWSIVPSPTGRLGLWAVSCVAATTCMATGQDAAPSGATYATLALQWDGTTWSRLVSPNAGTADELLGVSCKTPKVCAAAGWIGTTNAPYRTLVERWDGSKWDGVTSGNAGTDSNYLHGVSCWQATACMAVGKSVNGRTVDETLAEVWGNPAWTTVPSPNASPPDGSALLAVSCVGDNTMWCMAVGEHGTSQGAVRQTLAEVYR